MTRARSRLLAGLTFLLFQIFLLWTPTRAEAQGRLVFADEPVPPFCYGEPGGFAVRGIDYEILREVFRPLGREAVIELMPWERALKSVEHGRVDGMPALMVSPERERYMVFTDPVLTGHDRLFYHSDSARKFEEFKTIEDLEGLTMAVVSGYTFSENLLEFINSGRITVLYASDVEESLCWVFAGRVDCALEDEVMARYAMNNNPKWRSVVKMVEVPLSTYTWHMGLSRKSPVADMLDDINTVIQRLGRDGTLARILERME